MQGIEEDLKTDPPCHPRACAIQGRPSDRTAQLEYHLDVNADTVKRAYKRTITTRANVKNRLMLYTSAAMHFIRRMERMRAVFRVRSQIYSGVWLVDVCCQGDLLNGIAD